MLPCDAIIRWVNQTESEYGVHFFFCFICVTVFKWFVCFKKQSRARQKKGPLKMRASMQPDDDSATMMSTMPPPQKLRIRQKGVDTINSSPIISLLAHKLRRTDFFFYCFLSLVLFLLDVACVLNNCKNSMLLKYFH